MIQGHGDDIFRYRELLKMNFSSMTDGTSNTVFLSECAVGTVQNERKRFGRVMRNEKRDSGSNEISYAQSQCRSDNRSEYQRSDI